MQLLYNFSIKCLGGLLKMASFINPKAKLWIDGRMNWRQELVSKINTNKKTIWMHCASLGEFEQGRTLFEALKEKHSEYQFLVSFYSPSGYEVMKNYPVADYVFYLPLDTPNNTKDIVEIINPSLFILIKYDYWYNLLQELNHQKIKTIVVSAIFRTNQSYFKPYGNWFLKELKTINHFFVQDQNSYNLLTQKGFKNITISGDTRFDRAKQLPNQNNDLPIINNFKANKKVLIAGSTWAKDNQLILKFINENDTPNYKFIIVPHNINTKKISILKGNIHKKTILWSEYNNQNLTDYDVLIIDTVGLLTKIYSYASIAFVGGAFTKDGVHNVLEPAVFGIPVLFGPKINKFIEAKTLIEKNGGIIVTDYNDFKTNLITLMNDASYKQKIGYNAKKYVLEMPNSTATILATLNL